MCTFEINNTTWKVELTDKDENLTVKGKRCKGCTVYKNNTIYIDKAISQENQLYVLRHEMTHVVIYETQIELKEVYSEECLCEMVAMYGEFIINKSKELMDTLYNMQLQL